MMSSCSAAVHSGVFSGDFSVLCNEKVKGRGADVLLWLWRHLLVTIEYNSSWVAWKNISRSGLRWFLRWNISEPSQVVPGGWRGDGAMICSTIEPIPAVIGREAGCNLDRSTGWIRGNTTRQTNFHTSIHLKWPINLTWMCLEPNSTQKERTLDLQPKIKERKKKSNE